jgi:hypothetical protein
VVDQVYQPIVSDEDDQSETPPASELSIVDPAEFRRPVLVDQENELTAEDATVQRSRQPDPHSPESAYERPIVKHKIAGSGPISLNEAVDATHWARGHKLGEELATSSGLSQSQIEEMAADAIERGQRIDPLAPPPPKVEVTGYYGENEPLTVTEAADQLTDWRARHQEAQQQELQALVGEAEQERAEAQQAQQPTEQPQQQQPQPQPEMTPAQIERAQVAAERQLITNLKRIEGHEAALRLDYDRLVQTAIAEFPSLQHGPPDPADVEQLRQADPSRFHRLAQFDQALRDRQQRIAAIAHARGVHEQQQAQIDARARAAARAQQDQAFERLAAQHIPNWERISGEVRVQARKTLQAAGLSDDNMRRLWTGDESIDAHSSVLQLILAKAAQWDLAQEKARQVRQTPVPPVMKPGTYRARDDGAQSVRDLQAALKGAKGREALRLGTALTKARRAGG